MQNLVCVMSDCANPVLVKKRGLCRKHYRAFQRHGNPNGLANPVCDTCGSEFDRPGKSGMLPRYCSRECNPTALPDARQCIFCGTSFERLGTNRLHCSITCRDRWRRHGHQPIPEVRCTMCESQIDLKELGPSGRSRRVDSRLCRKCRRPASYPLTVADLARRDGSNCSLCGNQVDMTLVFPDRWSPSVDHVVPYSISQSNSPENLALAHLRCNIRKGNRVS